MVLRYKLNKVADKPKGTVVFLPEIHGSLSAEQSYLKILRSMLRQLAAQVRADVLPVVNAELKAQQAERKFQRDIDADIFTRLSAYAQMLSGVASNMVNRILRLEGQRHTRQFAANAKRALGVDLGAVVREEDLEGLLAAASVRNAALIKGLADDTVKRVANSVTTALMQGTPASVLQKTLAKDFGFSDNRAKVIARDQIAKLNSDMNRLRDEQAGLDKYRWRTSQDERVRPLHRSLDGKIYKWGEPTGAESGLPPGQPVLCRCVAQAVVEFEATAVAEKPRPAPAPAPTPRRRTQTPEARAAAAAARAARREEQVRQSVARGEALIAQMTARNANPLRPAPVAPPVSGQALAKIREMSAAMKVQVSGVDRLQPQELSDLMDKFFAGVDPEDFVKQMGYTPQGDTASRVTLEFEGLTYNRPVMRMRGKPILPNGGVATLDRSFHFGPRGDRYVSHDYFKLDAKATGGGYGKNLLRDQVKLYEKLGVTRVDVHANIDVGGYAWAKYGFVPSEESWEFMQRELKARVAHFIAEEGQTRPEYTAALDIIKSSDSTAIWAISDLGNGVGKKLLLGTDWEGELQLTNPGAKQRFESYVGK